MSATVHPLPIPVPRGKSPKTSYCHIYGQLSQAGKRLPEVLEGLSRRGIPADIDFVPGSERAILDACRQWEASGNIVAPCVYPYHLDPECTNHNWWAYSEEECARLLGLLQDRLRKDGFTRRDAINTYTPGNAFIRAATRLGFRHLLGFCAPTCANDGHWQLTHTGSPLAPFFPSADDFRKPGAPADDAGFLISSMELRNPFTCLENWNEGPFCPLNLLMGDRSIEPADFPLETMALCEDFLRLAELTDQPRFLQINLQYFTSPKCFDLNERMLDWLKVQEQSGRLQFVGLRDFADLARQCGGVLPQTTWWRGECMGQHVGGQRGQGSEAIVCENAEGQWQFRKGETGPERFFDYRKTWDYPAFDPKAELPLSEGYDVKVLSLASSELGENRVHIEFEASAEMSGGRRRFCLWDLLPETSGPYEIEATGEGILAIEVVPHPGGTGASILMDADFSKPLKGSVTLRHSGARTNDHSRNWQDLVVAETTWLHGEPITRVALTVPYPMDVSIRHLSRSPVKAEWVLGAKIGAQTVAPGEVWSGCLDGSRSASMVRFRGVNAAQIVIEAEDEAKLRAQAEAQTRKIAHTAGVELPEAAILRYTPERQFPEWLHDAARKGADTEIEKLRAIAVRMAGTGSIAAAIHMAADLPVGSKGRVRSAFFDRVEQSGAAEFFPIYYDFGQTYAPGVSGWAQFWRINLGVRNLKPDREYAVLLHVYDPEERGTPLRITAQATNREGETSESPEIVVSGYGRTAQGLSSRFDAQAFRLLRIPREVRGSEAVNLHLYGDGEQVVYDRLSEGLGFVFLSHAWLVEVGSE